MKTRRSSVLIALVCLPGYFDENGDAADGCEVAGTAEVCDGFDNDGDEQGDEDLPYCLGGQPAPNTDGAACQPGFVDTNGDPADGCEDG